MKDMLPRISDYPRAIARITPEAEALVLGDARIGYRALADRVDALARALLAAGIRKGDRVATLQTPHPDFLVAFLATAAIGGIWVGLNPKYRLEELAHVIQDSRPSVLIARARMMPASVSPCRCARSWTRAARWRVRRWTRRATGAAGGMPA
jgi:acyl-CoA synthetase (AMP-forming)/AMP-acid ligase II